MAEDTIQNALAHVTGGDSGLNGMGLLWFTAGAAIGASIALLFAPHAGHVTRGHIVRRTKEGREALADSGKEVLDRGREFFERARQLTEEASEMFEKGRKIVEGTAANLAE